MFGTALPVPSVAVCDAAHYAKDMWRGPVWVNVNWLIAEGLDRYGFRADAASLRQRTAAAVEEMAERYGTLFEFYDDRAEVDPPRLLRKGCCDASPDSPGGHLAIHDYGWTASLYVDMAYRLAGRACT
jgi:neutral trehalase